MRTFNNNFLLKMLNRIEPVEGARVTYFVYMYSFFSIKMRNYQKNYIKIQSLHYAQSYLTIDLKKINSIKKSKLGAGNSVQCTVLINRISKGKK